HAALPHHFHPGTYGVIHTATKLRVGDKVEVREPEEILKTLDPNGAVDYLPFMPEMLEFCGKRFQVSSRAFTTCFSGPGTRRAFNTDDVVTLSGVRCSGNAHDGCQKACLIFWREGWLRKVEDPLSRQVVDLRGVERLRTHLKILVRPNAYF